MEGSFNQMLAGSNAQNNSTSRCDGANNQTSSTGDHLVSMPESHLNMEMNSNASSAGSKSIMVRLNAHGVTVVSTIMSQIEEDVHELKRERKRLSKKESAKKPRVCRQQNSEDYLQARVEVLSNETSKLTYNLRKLSKLCMKLKKENKSLLKELKKTCVPDTISVLEAKDPDSVIESLNGESNS